MLSRRAHASIRNLCEPAGPVTVCLYQGEIESWDGIRRFEHGIFAVQKATGWALEFGMEQRTHVLPEALLQELLGLWIECPSEAIFLDYAI